MEVKEIRPIKHCILCQKRKYVDDIGTVCGLTNKRGEISETCADFIFREDIDEFVEQLKTEQKEYELTHIKLRKQMIKWFLTGLFMFVSGLIFWPMPWNHGAIHLLTISLIIIGAILMPQGAWEYFPHRMRLKAKHHETHKFMILIKHYKNIIK
jgi:hypothetical protein